METIKRNQVKELINNTNGHFFTCEFFKRNGELRSMNCRNGVTKHLTPNPTRTKPEVGQEMVCVYDVQNKGYRHINTNTVTKITTEHHTYEVK